jgi:hypothetical protein
MPVEVAAIPEKLRAMKEKKIPDETIMQWCNGHAWKFEQGVDFFHTKPGNFGSWLRRRAEALGFKSSMRVRGKFLYFQVIGQIGK